MKPALFRSSFSAYGRHRCVDCGCAVAADSPFGRPSAWCFDCYWFRRNVLDAIQDAAHRAVARAIAAGEIPAAARLNCTDCGRSADRYDHRDYTQPLRVDAVCARCNNWRGAADNWGDLPERIVRPGAYACRQAERRGGGQQPAIHRVIEHAGSATALARQLGIPPQHVLEWKKRGWASPMHVLALEQFSPDDVSIRDLLQDHQTAQEREALAIAA